MIDGKEAGSSRLSSANECHVLEPFQLVLCRRSRKLWLIGVVSLVTGIAVGRCTGWVLIDSISLDT